MTGGHWWVRCVRDDGFVFSERCISCGKTPKQVLAAWYAKRKAIRGLTPIR